MLGTWKAPSPTHIERALHYRLLVHPLVERAERIYIKRLLSAVPSLGALWKPRQVEQWLSSINWEISCHGINSPKLSSHGWAYYKRNLIKVRARYLVHLEDTGAFNDPFIESFDPDTGDKRTMSKGEARVLDLCLHEMGHLATHRFFRTGGHGDDWKRIGRAVGYVRNGCTSEKKRFIRMRTQSVPKWAACGEI